MMQESHSEHKLLEPKRRLHTAESLQVSPGMGRQDLELE